uniref:RRM domain-containing protein n=1 Tax=Cryptomonas curvata TaxID=233186 RepID=A0A7S0N228_9CRYP
MISPDAPSDLEAPELNWRSSIESDVNEYEAQGTSGDLNYPEINSIAQDESDTNENIDSSNSPDTGNEAESLEGIRVHTQQHMEDIEHWPQQQFWEEPEGQYFSDSPVTPTSSTEGAWRQGGEIPTQPRREAFEAPKYPQKARMKAAQRMDAALDRLPAATFRDPYGKRTAVTLFAGNLDFTAWHDDIYESLQIYFPAKKKIQLDNIVIPSYNGRHKGYAFITLSWVQEAQMDPADICVLCSGVTQVNSRFLYFQQLREDVATQKHAKAFQARPGIRTTTSMRANYHGVRMRQPT